MAIVVVEAVEVEVTDADGAEIDVAFMLVEVADAAGPLVVAIGDDVVDALVAGAPVVDETDEAEAEVETGAGAGDV